MQVTGTALLGVGAASSVAARADVLALRPRCGADDRWLLVGLPALGRPRALTQSSVWSQWLSAQ
jgi:hypothetical protein